MSASLALQEAVRTRLVTTPSVTALVPAKSILDRNSRPNPNPAIIIGEGQEIEGDDIARKSQEVVLDLHIWKKEVGLTGVKAIAGAIRAAINAPRFGDISGFHFTDCRVSAIRYLRDPDGETGHAVVTVSAITLEL